MDLLAPNGPVYQAGTLSGNPLAMAAGLATLRALKSESYLTLAELTCRLTDGINAIAKERGSPCMLKIAWDYLVYTSLNKNQCVTTVK